MTIVGRVACLLVATVATLSGCASRPKSYVVLLENPDGTAGRVIVTGSKGEQWIDKVGHGVPLDGVTPAAPVDEKTLAKDFGDAMAARPPLPLHFLLFFEFGSSTLTAESAAELEKVVEAVRTRPAADVSLIGHTDTVGKAELNEGLGLRRARAVAGLLNEKGVKARALTVESYGKRSPSVRTPDETAEVRNRRVEISVR